jgi:hypothetical protein
MAGKNRVNDYKAQYPMMRARYANKLKKDIKENVEEAMWKHYKEKQQERGALVAMRSVTETTTKFMERRQSLMDKYINRAVEKVIDQHFLTISDKPNAPQTMPCIECGFRNSDYFESFPPKNFREVLEETALLHIDRDDIEDQVKYAGAYIICQEFMHWWISAEPEERVGMGV